METLLLREQHLARGALLGERDGVELPLGYGDTFTEYKAAREAAALFDRSDRTILRFEGPDAVTWLHGMTTSDVKGLPVGQGQPTTLCTSKGKVIGLGTLIKRQEDLWLDLDPLCREPSLASLERLLITEDVIIHDASFKHSFLSLVGPKAAETLGALLGTVQLPEALWSYVNFEYAGQEVFLRRGRVGGLPALEAWTSGDALFELLAKNVPLAGWQAGELLRIEAGEPRYGKEVTDATIPQEAGLDDAISYTKGCYLGQETIARLHYRGHVNRHLRSFVFLQDGLVPQSGAGIFVDGEEKGKVTSACLSPRLQRPIAMGYIRREFAEPGTQVEVQVESGRASAEVRLNGAL